MLRLSCLLALLAVGQAAKVALFVPAMANSQVLFNKRVAEELTNGGHDVTLYMIQIMEKTLHKVAIDERVQVEYVNASAGLDGEMLSKLQAETAFHDLPPWHPKMRKHMALMSEMHKACEKLITNSTFLDHVRAHKYDVAFSHMYNQCAIGVIHITKIPTWVWLNSGALMDSVAAAVGVPLPPSYATPMMMEAGDQLTFYQRIKSFLGHLIFKAVWYHINIKPENEVFRRHFGEDFPDVGDLAKEAPLVMVNSNELYDFARPTLHKVVNIGGVGIKAKDAKPLQGEFGKRTNASKAIITMTFGSFAPMEYMPIEWRDAYFGAFRRFPDVQFFMRYEKPEAIASILPPNVYAAKWLPQTDLLQHPKSLGLISHGGYNSVQDVIHAGVPIVCTALFGDQLRNAHLVEKLGIGINVPKAAVSEDNIAAAIGRLVNDESLKRNAVELREQVASKPVSPEHLLNNWTTFLAKHKRLDNLVPAGRDYNVFVYHSVDVIAFLAVAVSVVLYVVYRVGRCAVCYCCRRARVQKEKTN